MGCGDASDPDGSPLLFSVYYGPDNGVSWRAIADNLDSTKLTISTRRLPGGASARIRVVACDGMNTAVGESAPFLCPLSAPDLTIDNLPEGARRPFGSPVKPLIFACDNEDGVLLPQWSVEGPIPSSESGAAPCLTGLAPGPYTLVVTASNREHRHRRRDRPFHPPHRPRPPRTHPPLPRRRVRNGTRPHRHLYFAIPSAIARATVLW